MLTKVIFVVVTVEFGNYCCMFVKSKRHGGVIRKQQRAKWIFFIGYKPRAVKISKKAVYMYVVYMAVSGELFSSYSFAVYR